MHGTRLCFAALGLATLAACGSSSAPAGDAPPSVPANPSGGAVAAQHAPCALFSTDQLDQVFGLKFSPGQAEQGSLQPTCDWYDTAAGVSAAAAVKKSSEASFDGDISGPLGKDYERTKPVLGDDSVWFDPASKDSVSLIVISNGYRYQVSIGVDSGSTTDQRRTQLLALAQATF